MADGLPLDTIRQVALGYRDDDELPHWSGKLVWHCSEGDRAAYEGLALDWRGVWKVTRRARLLCELHGVNACAALAAFEGRDVPDERGRWAALKRIEGAQVALRGRLRASCEGLVRAYGDLHYASDWLHRDLLGC